jgi:translation initiation factor 2 gamma subunit (eIF-2gamma)
MELLETALNENEYPVIPISVTKKINIDMFYKEIENKLNVYQGKEVKRLKIDAKDYNIVYNWIKR